MIMLDQLKLCIPYNKTPAVWLDPLNKLLTQYGLDSKLRAAAFIAECAHESTEFLALEENLHYKAQALLDNFGKYFQTLEKANAYANNPEKIANLVYANRLGNGNESSGDGWKYRGRGLIQITGKTNYTLFGQSIGYLLEDVPSFLTTPTGAIQSACWYWTDRPALNILADAGDIDRISRLINGGVNGLADRHQRYNKIITILGK